MKLSNIANILIQFNPYQPKTASTRAFLALVTSNKVRASNAKCEVKTVLTTDNSEPRIVVSFSDGVKTEWQPAQMKIKEMLIELEYNMARFPDEE